MRVTAFALKLGLLLLILLLPHTVFADVFEPGVKLRAGGFWAYMDTKLKGEIPGTKLTQEIDFESDLFLEETKFSPFLGITYRLNENHAIQLNYFSLHRQSDREIISKPFDFEFDGKTYRVAAGARLETLLDLDVYHLTYMYSFYSTDTLLVAGTIGAHVIRVKNGYRGEIGVVIDDSVYSYGGEGISESLTAPLPDFGLVTYYKVRDDIILSARAQYFKITVDNAGGELLDLHCEVLKYFDDDRHWAIGASYQYYGIKVDYSRKRYSLDLNLKYQGPTAFIQYDF